jgi:hypothetical protein
MGKKRKRPGKGQGQQFSAVQTSATFTQLQATQRKLKRRRGKRGKVAQNDTPTVTQDTPQPAENKRSEQRSLINRRGQKGTGGHGRFAVLQSEQKTSAASAKMKKIDEMRLRFLEKTLQKQRDAMRKFVVIPAPKKKVRHRNDRDGLLFGAARPAASLELSDHGCGLRQFECDERCQRVEDVTKDLWAELAASSTLSSHELGRQYCDSAMECAEMYYAFGRDADAVAMLRRILRLDKDDFVDAQAALDDIAANAGGVLPETEGNEEVLDSEEDSNDDEDDES